VGGVRNLDSGGDNRREVITVMLSQGNGVQGRGKCFQRFVGNGVGVPSWRAGMKKSGEGGEETRTLGGHNGPSRERLALVREKRDGGRGGSLSAPFPGKNPLLPR